ncbi:MAG: type II secretion system protein, partial [Haloarculaceae archaeon]
MTDGGSIPPRSVIAPTEAAGSESTDREELAAVLRRLGIDRSPAWVVRRANAGGATVALVGVAATLLTAAPAVATPLVIGLGVAVRGGVLATPRVAAAVRRSRALGEVPALVARATLRARVEPTAEAAAEAASDADGPLADSLAEHVRRARGTGRTGLAAFADEWEDPALRRAIGLVASATRAPVDERDRTLDRALSAALAGTRERAAEAAAAIHGPATALYAFGVLLPLSFVAGLPAARAAGVPVSAAGIALVYDLLLPAGICLAGAWLFARRPVAFPPAPVSPDHPAAQSRPTLVAGVGATAALVGSTTTVAVGAGWALPVVATGAGVGAALVARHRPARSIREHAAAVESGLPDALAAVGRRVRSGTAVERALGDAADATPGETGAVLADAARRGRRLGV